MIKCPLLHESIICEGGDKPLIEQECLSLCKIINEEELVKGSIVRYILLSKYKYSVNSEGGIRSGLFTINKKCLRKLSAIYKTETLQNDLKVGEPANSKIVGYTEIDIEKIHEIEGDLRVIQDNYKYEGANSLDFNNHCSLCSFSGKSLFELRNELKIHSNLAKICSKFIKSHGADMGH